MNPILFSKTETTFTSNGLGRLNVASCLVEESRNDKYEAVFTISKNEKHFELIELLSIVVIKVSDGTLQPFRVYKISNEMNDMRTVYCEHISYRLKDIPIDPFEAHSASAAMAGIKSHSLITNPFTFSTDVTTNVDFKLVLPNNARQCLGGIEGSILDQYGGEFKFDNWNVSLLKNRGADNGVILRYRKNITDFSNEIDLEDTITGIFPYWTNGTYWQGGDITYTQNQYTPLQRIVVEDVSSAFSDVTYSDNEGEKHGPTKAEVTEAGAEKLKEMSHPGVPRDNLKISFVNLADTEEYKDVAALETVHLCDLVTVIYEPYDINAKMKVTTTVWDALEERYDSIELGDARQTLVTELAKRETDLEMLLRLLNDSQGRIKKRFEVVEDGLEFEVSTRTAEGEDIYAELSMRIVNNDDGDELISLINAHADKIHFTANKVFQVDAPNWSVDEDGNIIIVGTLYYKNYASSTDPLKEIIKFSNGYVMFLPDSISASSVGRLPGATFQVVDSSLYGKDYEIQFLNSTKIEFHDKLWLFNGLSVESGTAEFVRGIWSGDTIQIDKGNSSTILGEYVHSKTVQLIQPTVTSSPANVHISESSGTNPDTGLPNGNYLQKVDAGSSIRYKNSVSEKLTNEMDPHRLYDLPVVKFKYNTDYLTNEEDQRYDKEVIGFIAEDIDKIFPQACEYNQAGQPDAWNEHYMIPAMLKLIQEQNERIKKLEKEVLKNDL